jgi:hypothetical protein
MFYLEKTQALKKASAETRTESMLYPFWASWAVFKKNASDTLSVTKDTKESIVFGQVRSI